MKKGLGLLFGIMFILLILQAVSSETLKEAGFESMGYGDFAVSGANIEKCEEIAFVKDWDGKYTVLSLHAELLPVAEGRAKVKVYLNDSNEALREFSVPDFIGGWARVVLMEDALEEKNKVKICARTTDTVTGIKILSDSKIGQYKMPYFEEPGAFVKSVSSTKPKVGEEVAVAVKLRNAGNEEVFVELRHRKPGIEMDEVQVIRGETEKSAWLKPEEEIAMEYYIKPKVGVKMTLPYAVASYTNIFGEKAVVYSEQPTLFVQPVAELEQWVIAKQAAAGLGEKVAVTIAIKNNGLNNVENVNARLVVPKGIEVDGLELQSLDYIEPNETARLAYYISASKPGTYKIGCEVYSLGVEEAVKCRETTVIYEAGGIGTVIIAGLVLLVIGIAIYLYIYLK